MSKTTNKFSPEVRARAVRMNIFAGNCCMAIIGAAPDESQVSPTILDAWSEAELAGHGLARATLVVSEIDKAAVALTGSYVAVYQGGVWQYLAETAPLSSEQRAVALMDARKARNTMLAAEYRAVAATPVEYTSLGGVTRTYQADDGSVSTLQLTLAGLSGAAQVAEAFDSGDAFLDLAGPSGRRLVHEFHQAGLHLHLAERRHHGFPFLGPAVPEFSGHCGDSG